MNARRRANALTHFACILSAVASLWATRSKADQPGTIEPRAAKSMLGKERQVRNDNGVKMKLVWCSPGFVTMERVKDITEPVGDEADEAGDDEADLKTEPAPKRRHPAPRKFRYRRITTPVKVLLTKGYWLGKYEVTQSEWKQVMKTEPWKPHISFAKSQFATRDGPDFPATYVNWDEATEFCRRLTGQERHAGRLPIEWEYALPTEAEWERACRARTETEFSFDDESKLGDYAWLDRNALHADEAYAHQVGRKKANPWGLFDMHGNVAEWCRNYYTDKLPGGRDPLPDENTWHSRRVVRGGSWNFQSCACRSAARGGCPPDSRSATLGFRIALSCVRQD